MSSSLDTWCDNCGKWSGANPEYAVSKIGGVLPRGWVSVEFSTCRLHLCDECLEIMRHALTSVHPCARPSRDWKGRDGLFLSESGNLQRWSEKILEKHKEESLKIKKSLEKLTKHSVKGRRKNDSISV